MVNQINERTRRGKKEYAVIGAFEKKENKYGRLILTLNGVIEILTLLQDAGFGDKYVGIGYDSDICYTSIDSEHIIFKVTEEEILINGSG